MQGNLRVFQIFLGFQLNSKGFKGFKLELRSGTNKQVYQGFHWDFKQFQVISRDFTVYREFLRKGISVPPPPPPPPGFGAIESYVFTGLLRHLLSMGGWPQRTRGSRRSRSARAQGRPLLSEFWYSDHVIHRPTDHALGVDHVAGGGPAEQQVMSVEPFHWLLSAYYYKMKTEGGTVSVVCHI